MAGLSLCDAKQTLSKVFGYPAFRPGQSAAVLSLLRGRDTLVILPTGGGKSLCYQVPAVMLPGLTVVVSPLISLMRDQVQALRRRGVAAAFVNSAQTAGESAEAIVRAERGELKMLYVAPERLEAGDIAERLRSRVCAVAVDEAHCISHWGHDFRPSYRRLSEARRRLGWPPAIALTATATPEVRTDIASQLRMRNPTVIVTGFDRTNLEYSVVAAKTDELKTPLIRRAVAASPGSSIVYASTKKSVDRIAASLIASGLPVGAYHAGLDSARRKSIQDSFMSGRLKTIVSTNAFGMGIDKPDVRLVVHHSMPGTLEAYYQEAGRAGRDGGASRVLLLHSYADRFTHEFFVANANPGRPAVEAIYAALRSGSHDGVFPGAPPDISLSGAPKISAKQAENAVMILERAGAVSVVSADASRVRIRLTATPERIRRELIGEASMEIGLLRALWISAGKELLLGAEIDLNGLPPGFGGPAICVPLLDALQAGQFLHWSRAGGGIRIEDPTAPIESLAIDWHVLERRRLAELGKLDTMQRYAYTRRCRRAFILGYFGETLRARRCTSCDNCRRLRRG